MNSASRTHTAAAASRRITNSMSPTGAGTLGSAARARPPRSPARPRRPRPGARRRAARARHVRRLPVPVLHGGAADPHARPRSGSTGGCGSASGTSRCASATPTPSAPRRRARRPRRRTRSGRCTTRSTGCAGGWGSRTSSARRAASGSTPSGSAPTWTRGPTRRACRRDVESALATGVGGTPTFFVERRAPRGRVRRPVADRGARGRLAAQLGDELVAERTGVDGDRPAGEVDVQRLADVDLELAAVERAR